MVESTLRNIDRMVSYKDTTSSRGKILRAEPSSACYELGMVHHVGEFPDLEDEMCSYTGEPGQPSPNRLDALVFSLTELGASARPHVYGGGAPDPEEQQAQAEEAELRRLREQMGEEAWAKMVAEEGA